MDTTEKLTQAFSLSFSLQPQAAITDETSDPSESTSEPNPANSLSQATAEYLLRAGVVNSGDRPHHHRVSQPWRSCPPTTDSPPINAAQITPSIAIANASTPIAQPGMDNRPLFRMELTSRFGSALI